MDNTREELDAIPGYYPTPSEEVARRRLASHFHFHGRADSFTFTFNDVSGVLTVQGVVPTYYLKQLAQNVLKTLRGVTRVNNQIRVAFDSDVRTAVGSTADVEDYAEDDQVEP